MDKFKAVQTCVQCSAKLLKNVNDVFHYGVEAVINPIAPLFDPEAQDGQGALTPLCAKALKRVFSISDKDKVICCYSPCSTSKTGISSAGSWRLFSSVYLVKHRIVSGFKGSGLTQALQKINLQKAGDVGSLEFHIYLCIALVLLLDFTVFMCRMELSMMKS